MNNLPFNKKKMTNLNIVNKIQFKEFKAISVISLQKKILFNNNKKKTIIKIFKIY